MPEGGKGEMRIGFAPAAREDEARAAARGFAPRMRWTWPAQCWAVRREVWYGLDVIVCGCGGEDAIMACGLGF